MSGSNFDPLQFWSPLKESLSCYMSLFLFTNSICTSLFTMLKLHYSAQLDIVVHNWGSVLNFILQGLAPSVDGCDTQYQHNYHYILLYSLFFHCRGSRYLYRDIKSGNYSIYLYTVYIFIPFKTRDQHYFCVALGGFFATEIDTSSYDFGGSMTKKSNN